MRAWAGAVESVHIEAYLEFAAVHEPNAKLEEDLGDITVQSDDSGGVGDLSRAVSPSPRCR